MSILDSQYKFPKVLQNQVRSALRALRHLPPEVVTQYLAIYRRNIVRQAAKLGLTGQDNASNVSSSEKPNELIPIEYIEDIRRMDEAFQALHKYNKPNGHLDYTSKDTFSEVQRLLAKSRSGTRTEDTRDLHNRVVKYLIRRGYSSSDNKMAIVIDAAKIFKRSRRTIEAIAKTANLTRKYKS